MTGAALADQLGWNQPRISRLETGRQVPSEAEAKELLDAVGASRADRKSLIEAIRSFDAEYTSTRTVLAKGAQHRQNEIRETEARATQIDSFWTVLVPGLLQTPDYTRTVADVDLDAEGLTIQEIDGAIELRAERQELLKDRSKRFSFLLYEPVLWARFGSASVARQQLARLQELTSGPKHVRLGIIPLTTPLPVLPMTGFTIYDDRLVNVDTLLGEINITATEDIDRYRSAFDRLSGCAVGGRAARAMIGDVAESLV